MVNFSDSRALELKQVDIDIFHRGRGYDNPTFWSRFSQRPDLTGATILEVGCGRGSLCVDMALAGAKYVVGLDINRDHVNFARENIKRNYPELINIVELTDVELRYYDEISFDFIVSKDTFEHIIDLPGMLREMKKRLKPGGRIYTGFGPLYTSPYGDHDRRQTSFRPWGAWGRFLASMPWAHLFLEPTIIKMWRRHRREDVRSMYDLGLNKMSVSDFRRVFQESGLYTVSLRVNQSNSIQSRVFSLLKRALILDDHCTHNIYCILEK